MKDREFNDYNINEDEFMTALDELEKLDLAELEAMAAQAEAEEEEPHEFSAEFMAKQAALIREVEEREQKIPFIYRFINTPVKKAAIVAILVGAVALGFGGQSEAGKNPIVKFFQERYGDHIEIEPHEDLWQNEEKPQTIETVYELGWVPEGYEKVEEEISEYDVIQLYASPNNEKIRLTQYCVNTFFSIDDQNEMYKEKIYKERRYYYSEESDERIVVWYQDGYQFMIRADLELEQIFKMANTLKK